MLKNYMKEGQKLPLFGVGPYIIYGIAVVNIVGIVLLCYVLKIGILDDPWTLIFRITGILLIVLGIAIWYIGALRSDMDDSITENRLQTKGIYAWVRNPMYSGWWIALSGITMMWHNVWLLIFPIIDWLIDHGLSNVTCLYGCSMGGSLERSRIWGMVASLRFIRKSL